MADGDIAMESSQGESLQRASTHLDVLQSALGEITAEATRLKSLCKTYRAQRTELEATLATLKADVSRMGDEKEEARLDLVAEKEALAWWAMREQKEGVGGASGGASGHMTPTPGAVRDLRSKAETAGRAIRRAHFFEGQVKEAEVRYQALEKKKEDAVQEEMAISAGLRDRIGRLEGKLRVAEQGKADATALAERERKEREEQSTLRQDKEARWKSEKEDMLHLRDELRGQLRAAEEKVVQLLRERQTPTAEGQSTKISSAHVEGATKSISRPLTPLQTNRPILTPPSRSNRSPPRSSVPTTPSSLAKRLAYVEDRHRILQGEYDKIRAQHESDLRSWREWKTAHLARQDEKKAKRAKRRAERIINGAAGADVRSATEEPGDLGPTQAPSTASGAATQVRPPVAIVVEASQESSVQELDEGGDGQAVEGVVSLDGAAQRAEAERGTDMVQGGQEANRFLDVHPPSPAPDIGDLTELPEWVSPMDPTHSQHVRAVDEIQLKHAHHRINERDLSMFDGQQQQPAGTAMMPQLDQNIHHSPDREQSHQTDQRPRTAPLLAPTASFAAQRHRLTSPTKAHGTPQHNTPASVHHATRTTPWLGKAPLGRTGSASAQARTLQTMDDDIFASPPDADTSRNDPPIPTFSTTTPAKLLVRDRTGRTAMPGGAAPNSLLRTALLGRNADHDAVGPSEDQVTPSRSAGSSSRMGHTPLRRTESGGSTSRLSGKIDVPRTPGQAGTGTGAKRKINQVDLAELDFAEMTPHEKQLYRKRLAQLPEQERREVYKGYKGKGRYLPPEQLQKNIADEYEIDPKLNEGHTHQYHDVKRKRSERRKMHGSDCECCRDYYEAVGHIPRYNQGPKWNDGTTGPAGERSAGGDAVHEHQQLVSRHRETWAVGGTPPGYWSIGFPTSQDAAEQNRRAAEMTREKEARIRQDAKLGTGKYRRKADA